MSEKPVKSRVELTGLTRQAALLLVERCVREILGSEMPIRSTSSMRALAIKSQARLSEVAKAVARALLTQGFKVSAASLKVDAGMSISGLASLVVKLARPMGKAKPAKIKLPLHVGIPGISGLGVGFGGFLGPTRSGFQTISPGPRLGFGSFVGDRPAKTSGKPMKAAPRPAPKPPKASAKKAARGKVAAKKVAMKVSAVIVPPLPGEPNSPPAKPTLSPMKPSPAKTAGASAGGGKWVPRPHANGGATPDGPPPQADLAPAEDWDTSPADASDLAKASQDVAEQTARIYQQLQQQEQMYQAQVFSMSQMREQTTAAYRDMSERWTQFMRDVPAAEAPADVTVNATPQMDFVGPPEDKVYPVAVWVDQGPAAAGADVQGLTLQVSEDTTECRVDVWMDCSAHFKVDDLAADAHLAVTVKTGTSDKLPFKLRVVDEALDLPMYVTAFFRYEGRPCGKIARAAEIADGGLRWKHPEKPDAPAKQAEVLLPLANAPAAIAIKSGKHADIRVEVIATKAHDGQHFLMTCEAGDQTWKGELNLDSPPRDLVKALMDVFMKNKKKARIGSLKGAGMQMWKTLDPDAAAFLLGAIQKGAATMSVLSEEPFIPWELMVPHTTPQDAGEPLGIRMQMGRWIAGNYIAPPQVLPMKSAYLISPVSEELACAPTEIQFLLDTVKPSDQLTPATIEGIDTGLAAPPRDVLHFVCHGKSGLLQTLKLNSPDELDCVTVLGLEGFLNAFGHRPMVFLNACEVGSGTASLDGVGGFANSFMQLGAAAVVAPLWAVQDKAALEVTRKFYPAALAGTSLAKIFQDVRRMAYTGDAPLDSYAAYCFYGDPLAAASVA